MKKTITTALASLIIVVSFMGMFAITMDNAMASFASALAGETKPVVESVEKETFFNGGRGEEIINEVKTEFAGLFNGTFLN